MTNPHLTPEQLVSLLDDPAQMTPHLQSCAACRHELTQLRTTLTNFRTTLTAVAEQQATYHPRPSRPRTRAWVLSAAGLAFAIALVPVLHHPHPAPAAVPTYTDQDDQALLEDIDRDLATPIAPPLNPLAVTTPAHQ